MEAWTPYHDISVQTDSFKSVDGGFSLETEKIDESMVLSAGLRFALIKGFQWGSSSKKQSTSKVC